MFFFVYAAVYLIQWLISLFAAVYRLPRFAENQEYVERVFTDRVADATPVSVIIPAFNERACICDTVDSLLNNNYPNLEIIVVDDGSTDATANTLVRTYNLQPTALSSDTEELHTQPVERCYAQSIGGKRILLICKQNGGKGDALNCGFNFATSPYCMVVDADTQVRPGAIRIMANRFIMDRRTVVCAGAVGTQPKRQEVYRHLSLPHKMLVLFQRVEYYRTFYMHRVLFDELNANIIVSGAFAMFDRKLVIQAGGYQTDTIGEDMELTMRLHAFCLSQHRNYKIAYVPEARCDTQVPFHYKDYIRQRRRWHIGLMQSLGRHIYMIGSHHYGWVGILTVVFALVYELLAPFIEALGVFILIFSWTQGILGITSSIEIMAGYLVLSLMTLSLLFSALRTYRVESISLGEQLKLLMVAACEWLVFHPINAIVKVVSVFSYRRYSKSWNHIRRFEDSLSRK